MVTGSNSLPVQQAIKAGIDTMMTLQDERGEINSKIAAAREEVKSFGIDTGAITLAIRSARLDQDKRIKADQGFSMAREAMGIPFQGEMFATDEMVPGAEKAHEIFDPE